MSKKKPDNFDIDDIGKVIAEWQVPEFIKFERSRRWYIAAILIGLGLIIYSIFTLNYLFAVITLIGGLLLVMRDGTVPRLVKVIIAEDGVAVGRKFFDYDAISSFYIIYKPKEDIKNLYFEFKNPFQHRLSIPLENVNPLPIRNFLLQYLKEDLEKEGIPYSEWLGKIFKI